jgi:REP element-mobilizing transposase RayT
MKTGASPDRQNKPSPLISGLHSRGALPHLKREGASYFVTFRLAGSLPKQVLQKLKIERDAMVQKALSQNRPLTWREQTDLFDWYARRVDGILDAGNGECFLSMPEVATLVANALRFFDGQRYVLRAWVVMPNHVHAVVRPTSPNNLSSILKSWKGYTSNQANRLLDRQGRAFWQKESYDHCCRDEDDFQKCSAYTTMNPVRAGLCERAEDWLWSSAKPQAA